MTISRRVVQDRSTVFQNSAAADKHRVFSISIRHPYLCNTETTSENWLLAFCRVDLRGDVAKDIKKMEMAGTRPKHARAPPGAPSPVTQRRTYPRDAFRRRTKSKYRERYKIV